MRLRVAVAVSGSGNLRLIRVPGIRQGSCISRGSALRVHAKVMTRPSFDTPILQCWKVSDGYAAKEAPCPIKFSSAGALTCYIVVT
jgi:hypothetical protein